MNKRFYITLGVIYLLAGALFGYKFIEPLIHHGLSNYNSGQAAVAAKEGTPKISGMPVHITLPRLNIDIPVAAGTYNPASQTWSLSSTEAEFATVTAEPNNKSGNTFIYGHNRNQVFTYLLNAQPNEKAIVTTANGHTFTYTLASVRDTDPSDLSLFYYKGPPILTLQTCSGLFYQHRRLFTFNFTSVS